MTYRFFPGTLSSILALAVATFSGAVAAAPAPPPTQPVAAVQSTRTVTYILQNHQQHVTLTSGTGKTLLARQSATPTLQLVLSFLPTVTAEAEAAHVPYKPQQVSLVLQDQNGLSLWSQIISFGPKENNFDLSTQEDEAAKKTRLTLRISSKKSDATLSDSYAPPPRSIVSIGAEGQVLGVKSGDEKLVATRNGAGGTSVAITSLDGSGESAALTLGKDGKGMAIINGRRIPIERIKQDGKDYVSFAWNGHNVFIGGDCTFDLHSNGDLTVNPPSATK